MKSISKIKQTNFDLHFFKTENWLSFKSDFESPCSSRCLPIAEYLCGHWEMSCQNTCSDILINTQRYISYLRAPMYYSLYNIFVLRLYLPLHWGVSSPNTASPVACTCDETWATDFPTILLSIAACWIGTKQIYLTASEGIVPGVNFCISWKRFTLPRSPYHPSPLLFV